MPGYPIFNGFSDFAIAGPRKIKEFQKLSKLIVVHNTKFKLAFAVIQGNKFRDSVPECRSNGVFG
jgi:hypothetical protein